MVTMGDAREIQQVYLGKPLGMLRQNSVTDRMPLLAHNQQCHCIERTVGTYQRHTINT